MAFWIYKADRVSTEHSHEYDEYMLVVEGEYKVEELKPVHVQSMLLADSE